MLCISPKVGLSFSPSYCSYDMIQNYELTDIFTLLRFSTSTAYMWLNMCWVSLIVALMSNSWIVHNLWQKSVVFGLILSVNTVMLISLQLPDLMHSEALQAYPLVTFMLQNLGLLLGFIIMLIIALYEEDLMAIKF